MSLNSIETVIILVGVVASLLTIYREWRLISGLLLITISALFMILGVILFFSFFLFIFISTLLIADETYRFFWGIPGKYSLLYLAFIIGGVAIMMILWESTSRGVNFLREHKRLKNINKIIDKLDPRELFLNKCMDIAFKLIKNK